MLHSTPSFLVVYMATLVFAVRATPAVAQTNDAVISAGAKSESELAGETFEFRWCPPGEFLMGSPPGTDRKYGDRFVKQHHVKLTRGFWMQATEVTQSQFAAVMGRNPSSWNHGSGNSHPVERVTWDDAVRFCQALTKLDPKHEYRLPTEAEWEFACRAGEPKCRYGEILKTSWVFMNTDEGQGSSGHRPVGTKLPNRWGLHDMFGNVAEWCGDWTARPATETQVDPKGPPKGKARVVRGDDCFVCWTFLRNDGFCMAGSRSAADPSNPSRLIGFRVVRTRKNNGETKP